MEHCDWKAISSRRWGGSDNLKLRGWWRRIEEDEGRDDEENDEDKENWFVDSRSTEYSNWRNTIYIRLI